MAGRAEELARRFEQRLEELIRAVEGCPEERWRASCADTGWSANVQARHVAEGAASVAGILRRVAAGEQVPPLDMAQIDRGNAEHARQHAGCDKAEVLALLRKNGGEAAATIRGLSDEQLERTWAMVEGRPPWPLARVVELLSIGEIERHGGALKQTVGA